MSVQLNKSPVGKTPAPESGIKPRLPCLADKLIKLLQIFLLSKEKYAGTETEIKICSQINTVIIPQFLKIVKYNHNRFYIVLKLTFTIRNK